MIKKKFECLCIRCPKFKYSEKYDSYYCTKRNVWLESGCSDPTCEYCKDKPATPKKKKSPTKKELDDFNKAVKKANKK